MRNTMKQTLRSTRPWRYLVVSLLAVSFAFATYAAISGFGGRLEGIAIEIAPTAEGLFLIQDKDVERRLDDSPFGQLVGQSVKHIDLNAVEAFLTDDPFVDKAEVYVRYDGTLRVSIRQYEPILRVHDRRGVDYYLSPRGDVVPLSKHAVARVPVLTGQVRGFKAAANDSLPIPAFALAARIAGDPFLSAFVEQIDLRDGEYTLIPKIGTAEFLLGSLEDLDEKLHRLDAFVRGVYPDSGWEFYERVDLRYDGLAFGTKAPSRA